MISEAPPDYQEEMRLGGLPVIAHVYFINGETIIWHPSGLVETLPAIATELTYADDIGAGLEGEAGAGAAGCEGFP